MDIIGFIVKAIIVSVFSCGWIGSTQAVSTSEMRTHLISVKYNPYGYSANDDTKSPDDPFGQESIKIENRQLYDTVKHASGYDPDANVNTSRTNDSNDKQNSSSAKIFVAPRKSAVIQAIPRKVRGPGGSSSSTTTSSPYTRHPSLHAAAKDYGTGEPTTTIVYATSIPTTSSRTYVNIRPVPLLPTQKYRSTLSEDKQDKSETPDSPKPVSEKFFEEEKDHQQQDQQKSQLNVVLEKPAYKEDSSSEQATTTPGTYDVAPYHIEQRKRNLYKSIPYARIRTNEDIDKMPAHNRNSFVNPYPNHKWSSEDFVPRMSHSLPLPPANPPSPQFVYDNSPDIQQSFYQPSPNQHDYSPRYPAADEYHDEMYRNMMHSKPIYTHHQPAPFTSILAQQQDQQRQAYQPLTVRDFELLLQLLVLRERRLSGSQEHVYPSTGSDGNFYGPPVLRNREGGLARPASQQSSVRLLPPNVREELLFRMLLLALHMQPLTKPTPVVRNHQILPPQYTYLNPPVGESPPPYLGYRQHSGGVSKNPIRSVQVLGEID